MVKHTSSHASLAMVVLFDLEFKKLDVKTTFFHGDLKDIYMYDPEGFVVEGK